MVKNLPSRRSQTPRFHSWVRRSPGEETENPLQYSCLGSPKDNGAWRATLHEVTKSQTLLSMAHTLSPHTGVSYNHACETGKPLMFPEIGKLKQNSKVPLFWNLLTDQCNQNVPQLKQLQKHPDVIPKGNNINYLYKNVT